MEIVNVVHLVAFPSAERGMHPLCGPAVFGKVWQWESLSEWLRFNAYSADNWHDKCNDCLVRLSGWVFDYAQLVASMGSGGPERVLPERRRSPELYEHGHYYGQCPVGFGGYCDGWQ